MFTSRINQLITTILLPKKEENVIVELLLERIQCNGVDSVLNNIFTVNTKLGCFKALSYKVHTYRPAKIHQNVTQLKKILH